MQSQNMITGKHGLLPVRMVSMKAGQYGHARIKVVNVDVVVMETKRNLEHSVRGTIHSLNERIEDLEMLLATLKGTRDLMLKFHKELEE